jgi:hypothetical protein
LLVPNPTNAINYHHTQEGSNWIVKMATVMLKICKEEKTKAALAAKKIDLAAEKNNIFSN